MPSFLDRVKSVLANIGFPVSALKSSTPTQTTAFPEDHLPNRSGWVDDNGVSTRTFSRDEIAPFFRHVPPSTAYFHVPPPDRYDLAPAPGGSRVLVADMSSAVANALKEDISVQLHRGSSKNDDYIQSGFERFHADNPEVFKLLVDLALSAKANGHSRMGMKMLFERVRWHYTVDVKTKEPWKINNSYTALYARKIMQEVPSLGGFFSTRVRY